MEDIADSALSQKSAHDINYLYPKLYQELRRIAHYQLRSSWDKNTICTTSLVNEAYIKLVSYQKEPPKSRSHFFAIAAQAMRQIIINYAESKYAAKRGGDWARVTMAALEKEKETDVPSLLLLNDALEELGKIAPDLEKLVEMRFFAGMNEKEIAEVLNVSDRTVRRQWKQARALLTKAMEM